MDKIISIDLSNIYDIEEVHKILKEKLNFPSYYGMNLDSLNECIDELDSIKDIELILNKNNINEINEMIKILINSNYVNLNIKYVSNYNDIYSN